MSDTAHTSEITARAQRDADLANRFSTHAVDKTAMDLMADIRAFGLSFARMLNDNIPHSRELSTAITHLDHAVMNAVAAIARNKV